MKSLPTLISRILSTTTYFLLFQQNIAPTDAVAMKKKSSKGDRANLQPLPAHSPRSLTAHRIAKNNAKNEDPPKRNKCKLCIGTWSVPDPTYRVNGQSCSYWNNLDIVDEDCLMYQSIYGATCGCAHAPLPPCEVCDRYEDSIWIKNPGSVDVYVVDQCIRMVMDLSHDPILCAHASPDVANMCCKNKKSKKTSKGKKNDDHIHRDPRYHDDYFLQANKYDLRPPGFYHDHPHSQNDDLYLFPDYKGSKKKGKKSYVYTSYGK